MVKDPALLVKLTHNFIVGKNFSDDCWDKSDLTTAEGCIRAILVGDTQPDEYYVIDLKEAGMKVLEGWREWQNTFDCCYLWESVLADWFVAVAPAFEDKTTIDVYPDSGNWSYEVKGSVATKV